MHVFLWQQHEGKRLKTGGWARRKWLRKKSSYGCYPKVPCDSPVQVSALPGSLDSEPHLLKPPASLWTAGPYRLSGSELVFLSSLLHPFLIDLFVWDRLLRPGRPPSCWDYSHEPHSQPSGSSVYFKVFRLPLTLNSLCSWVCHPCLYLLSAGIITPSFMWC